MANSDNPSVRNYALQSLDLSGGLRNIRAVAGPPSARTLLAFGPSIGKQRRIYSLNGEPPSLLRLPGQLVRGEGDTDTNDSAVDEAYEGAGNTYDFYLEVFQRKSLDGSDMPIVSTVHADKNFTNAFWNGQQMVYGDGDGTVFQRFTHSLDVIAHEMTHGVISYECDLQYEGQPGALNEHFADVFGTMIRQKHGADRPIPVGEDHWLIGKDLLKDPSATRRGLRDMRNPGTAFLNDPYLGSDPQPGHMDQFNTERGDNSGVHINSGIPNRAFCLAALEIGGYSWQHVGRIWYEAMRALPSSADFAAMAGTTRRLAQTYTDHEGVYVAVDRGWTAVGL